MEWELINLELELSGIDKIELTPCLMTLKGVGGYIDIVGNFHCPLVLHVREWENRDGMERRKQHLQYEVASARHVSQSSWEFLRWWNNR